MVYGKPTVSKNFQETRKELSFTENRLIRFKSVEKPDKCPKYEQLEQRISKTLKNYLNNDLISQLDLITFILKKNCLNLLACQH